MTRLDYNKQILDYLKTYLEENPDIRFWQALANLNIVSYVRTNLKPIVIDGFNEEPKETLMKIEKIWKLEKES
jgi:hypothetical protein